MARKPAEALNLLRKSPMFAKFDDTSFAAAVADQALKMMWDEYSWREAMVTLPPFYMTPGESDAVVGTTVPTDFLNLDKAWLREVTSGNTDPLAVLRTLTPSSIQSKPEQIAYLPEIGGFRLHPKPGSGYGSPFWQVEGAYKKKATTITGSTLEDTALPFDDRFFESYKQALKYIYLDIVGSKDAGEAMFQNGFISYSGQLGKYKSALWEAIERENIQRGAEYRVPTDGIMLG